VCRSRRWRLCGAGRAALAVVVSTPPTASRTTSRPVRGELPDAVGGPFAVSDRFSAERLYVPVVVRGGCADDAGPARSCDLDGEGTHSASRSVHEQGLAGLNVQDVDDGLVGGQSLPAGGRLPRRSSWRGGLRTRVRTSAATQFGHAAVGTLHVTAYVPDDLVSRGELRGVARPGRSTTPRDLSQPGMTGKYVLTAPSSAPAAVPGRRGSARRPVPVPGPSRHEVLGSGNSVSSRTSGPPVAAVDHGFHHAPGTAIGTDRPQGARLPGPCARRS